MSRAVWLLVGAVLSACGAGCQPSATEGRALVVTGSPTLVPLMREVGKEFESAHPGVRVDVTASSSDRGVTAVQQGLADVGMAARPLRAEEIGLQAVGVARDGLALLVNKSNPVGPLSEEQLGGLLSGALTSWKQVGGRDAPVVLVGPGEGRLPRELVLQHFGLASTQLRAQPAVADSAQGVELVAGQPAALGYVWLSAAWAGASAGKPIRLLPLNGVAPTPENVQGGRYRPVRVLALVLRQPPAPLAEELVSSARSPAWGERVRKYFLVPIAP
jgi:phosphate transport system substrate-binding protein